MSKSFYFALFLLLILLGVYWYNQDLPLKPNKQNISAAVTKNFPLKTVGSEFDEDIENIAKPNSKILENFEDILGIKDKKKADSESESEDASNSKGGQTNVLVNPSQNGGVQFDVLGNRIDPEGGYARLGGRGASELDALREAASLFGGNRNNSLIPGVRVSGPNTDDDSEALVPTPIPQPTATPNTELKDVTGQARGYTMLYLMHPKARQTVERQLDAMIRSKVQQLYLGVLVDGTFGRDFNYLSNVIRKIAREKRSLVLVLYLSNGATMRSEDSLAQAPFDEYTVEEFRDAIQNNPAVQNRFIELTKPVLPVLQLNRRLNESNRNYVIPMLEDDLDDASYLTMRRLAQSVIGTRASYMRNPTGMIEGSTLSGLGDAVESHTPEGIRELELRDGFSLDGISYSLNSDSTPPELSLQDTKSLIATGASQGLRYFGLWRLERQGLSPGIAPLPVNERTFEVPSEADILTEIDLLRIGLTEVQ